MADSNWPRRDHYRGWLEPRRSWWGTLVDQDREYLIARTEVAARFHKQARKLPWWRRWFWSKS